MHPKTEPYRQYAYVGPKEILKVLATSSPGRPIRNQADLRAWLASHSADMVNGRITATFVVDLQGILRLAGRHSEHVACAGGKEVLSAGEIRLELEGDKVEITMISNQSTGYCPEPGSWPALQNALQSLEVEVPNGFSRAFIFRWCTNCKNINLVKEGVFECSICEADLPAKWNFGERWG